ncbi:MAG: TetR/AcrR family transcriptional regulator, partial [Dietzia cercidiphylli]
RSAAFHAALVKPLMTALEDLDDPAPALTADLINALVLAGARRLEAGDAFDAVSDAVARLVDPYLDRA